MTAAAPSPVRATTPIVGRRGGRARVAAHWWTSLIGADDPGGVARAGRPADRAYLAHTPYHLMLAVGLQFRDGCPKALLLFADESGFLPAAPGVSSVLGTANLELLTVRPIGGLKRWQVPVLERWRSRGNPLPGDALRYGSCVYLFNGRRPQAQRLLKYGRGRWRFAFVEDGLDAYFPHEAGNVPRWRSIAYRLWHGNQIELLVAPWDATTFESYHMLYPSLAPISADRRVTEIPADDFRDAVSQIAANLSASDLPDRIDALVLLDHSESVSDVSSYFRGVAALCERLRAELPSATVAVKLHPRESRREFQSLLEGVGARAIPAWIPAELLADRMPSSGDVICGACTFLLSSRALLPSRKASFRRSQEPEHWARHHDWTVLSRWDTNITIADGWS